MFKKPFKIKTNTQVKASERKSFKDLLQKNFPVFTDADLNELLNKKDVLNNVKIITHEELVVQVYTIQKRPMVFEAQGQIYPTVYLLWKFPHLVHAFTTHPQVMNFISSGADLMLPGVVTPPSQTNLPKYGSLSENMVCCVNMSNNKAAVAVGLSSQSSDSMLRSNSRGKCVTICHFYGDKLCSLESMAYSKIPNLGPPEWLLLKSYDDDFPQLGEVNSPKLDTPDKDVCVNLSECNIQDDNREDNIENNPEETTIKVETVENMDELLDYCFLAAIKYSKTITLPLLTSNFNKLQLLPVCPEGKTLDIKKTSFKKLKPFLEKMQELGIISIKEIKKGVEAITAINKNHPKVCEFYMTPENRPKNENNENENIQTTSVMESYVITNSVLPIFNVEGLQKGDIVRGADVKKHVTKYVKENNCQDITNPKLVKPNEILSTICKTENPISWEELIEKVTASMKSCYKVTSGAEEILNKGKVSPITLSVSVRSGNKKVTLIDNLELYGIKIPEFAKECQHGVAASTSISKPPGKKYDQLLVQGNQILFVYNLLTEKYKVPKKYIKGLENAPKKKK